MDKKKNISCHVTYSFWTMIGLFVLMMVLSYLRLQVPSIIAGALFMISVLYVFIASIMAIFPENSMAYIALSMASVLLLFLIISGAISAAGGMV